jgi:glycerophosphoryl diester phosphodiesterase
MPDGLRLVGHKGADLIAPGNTIESFHAAVQAGVDTIELDVLWLRDAHLPLEQRAPLVVAHDWHDAERRTPLTLTEALDAFLEPPLDLIEIDIDIKLPGREEEIVEALQERGLIERAMVSTMELYSLGRIRELNPALRRGWTYPKVTRDWTSKRWAKAPMLVALVAMRHRLPGLAAEKLPRLEVESMWVYHPLVSRRLARITEIAGVELIAWTVDDLSRMRKLAAAGVTGICSNDPRLFRELDDIPPVS